MAFQTGGEVSPIFQTVAIASNVPLDPEDQVAGAADPSGLPLATLEKLRANGVVIVASFTRSTTFDGTLHSDLPSRGLPLRLDEATHYVQYGTQVRTGGSARTVADPGNRERTPGRRHRLLRDGHARPRPCAPTRTGSSSDSLFSARARRRTRTGSARRQRSSGEHDDRSRGAGAGRRPDALVHDRRPRWSPRRLRGSQTGFKKGDVYQTLAQANVTTAGSQITTQPNNYQPQLVAMTAGYPPKPPLTSGGVGYDGKRCVPAKANVPLERSAGSRAASRTSSASSPSASRRARCSSTSGSSSISKPAVVDKKSRFFQALGRIKMGQIAVRSSTGKPLVYVDVVDSGRSRAFTAGSCV